MMMMVPEMNYQSHGGRLNTADADRIRVRLRKWMLKSGSTDGRGLKIQGSQISAADPAVQCSTVSGAT